MPFLRSWGFALVWGLFAIVWIARSRSANQTEASEPRSSRLIHLSLLAAAFVLIFASGLRLGSLDVELLGPSDALFVVGLTIALLGVVFMIWARQHLGLYWSGTITLKEGHRLIRTGPYRFVRHPIYSGFVLAIAGSGLAQGNLRGLLAIAIAVTAYARKIRLEESWLAAHFGEEYARFQREVRALIPLVW